MGIKKENAKMKKGMRKRSLILSPIKSGIILLLNGIEKLVYVCFFNITVDFLKGFNVELCICFFSK